MMKSSMRLCSLGSTHWSGLNVPFAPSPRGTWHAIFVGRSSTLNLVMGPAPDLPAKRLAPLSSTPHASGVTRPSPVITTRRTGRKSRVGFVDIFDRVADSHDEFRRIIANVDAEFLFKRHHQLDGVEAVGA